jgi:hypothetical protein
MPAIESYSHCSLQKPVYPTIGLISSLLFFVLLMLACPLGKAMAADITLAWDQNSDPDLAGYRLYIGTSSRNYTQTFDLGLTTQYTIGNLNDGTVYFFTLTAYNQKGLESSFSNEVRYPPYTHRFFLPVVLQGD